jgi:hypothetical protein
MKLKQFDVGTFNLFNLNKPGLPIYTDADGWTQTQYDLKIAWTARNLKIMNADIFGFQEMWHGDVIVDALTAAGLTADYDLISPPLADGTKIVCAAIVRKGLLTGTPRWIENFPPEFVLQSSGDDAQTPVIEVTIKGFSRPVLHFTVKLRDDEPDVNVYVCHLKSKAPTKVFTESWFKANKTFYAKHAEGLGSSLSTIRRTAEAAALRFILTEAMKGNDNPVIVLGDINDGEFSNTANILTEQPKYLVGDSVGGGDTALYTAQTLQEYRDTRDVYYTHVFQDIRESLDHILVSQEFYDNSKKRLWLFDGLVINNDHLNFDDHKVSGTNDHGIIRARFIHKPIKSV